MSTEFNPMEGLLADLLSTWDEEPTAVPEGELLHLSPPLPPVMPPSMVEQPLMVAEVTDSFAALPHQLPAPIRFVSALTQPVPREPIFLDPAEVKPPEECPNSTNSPGPALADPAPVAQTFFVDEDVQANARLDAVVTVADAKWLADRLKDAPEAKNRSPLPTSSC